MNVTLVHISDIHFCGEDRAAIKIVAEYLREIRPSAIIASGDLTARGSSSEMKAAFDWLRELPAPALATPGNHDTPYLGILDRLIDPFGRFLRESDGVRTEAWETPDFVIIPINTARGVQFRLNWALGSHIGGAGQGGLDPPAPGADQRAEDRRHAPSAGLAGERPHPGRYARRSRGAHRPDGRRRGSVPERTPACLRHAGGRIRRPLGHGVDGGDPFVATSRRTWRIHGDPSTGGPCPG